MTAGEAKRDPESRASRLHDGWRQISEYEDFEIRGTSTHEDIEEFWSHPTPLGEQHFNEWPVFSGLGTHGTALYLLGVHHDLAQWVQPGPEDDDERRSVRDLLFQTLSGFVDPFANKEPDFTYEVLLHFGERSRRVLASKNVFGYDDLMSLEHVIDGSFDARGCFKGRVIAFGKISDSRSSSRAARCRRTVEMNSGLSSSASEHSSKIVRRRRIPSSNSSI